MIEQAMYFGLGFCVAALIALCVLPAFWSRAIRLTRRRLEAQMATSPEQITAARDQLRAEFAVEHRRMELERDEATQHRHADLVEIGTLTMRLRAMDDQIADVKRAHAELGQTLAAQVASAEMLATELEAEKSAHRLLEQAHENLAHEHAALASEHESLIQVALERKAELISVETLIDGLRARARDLETMLATSRNEVNARSQALRSLEKTSRDLAAEARERQEALELAQARIGEISARIEERDRERALLLSELDAARKELRTASASAETAGKALAAERKRLKTLETRLTRKLDAASLEVGALTDRVEILSSEKSLAEGALESARADRSRLQSELRALRAGLEGGKIEVHPALMEQLRKQAEEQGVGG